MQIQINLILALTAIHNYIRIEAGIGALEAGIKDEKTPPKIKIETLPDLIKSTMSTIDRKREDIAKKI